MIEFGRGLCRCAVCCAGLHVVTRAGLSLYGITARIDGQGADGQESI